MTASAFDPSAGQPVPSRSTENTSGKPVHPLAERQLLESVLRETLAHVADGEPLAAADWQGLRSVVERHRGAPFACEPIVSDLVGALLHERLTGWGLNPAAQAAMSTRIAETLFDDVASRDRLRVLWERLREMPLSEAPP